MKKGVIDNYSDTHILDSCELLVRLQDHETTEKFICDILEHEMKAINKLSDFYEITPPEKAFAYVDSNTLQGYQRGNKIFTTQNAFENIHFDYISTILHEFRHYLQECYIKSGIKFDESEESKINLFRKNWKNYKSSKDHFLLYYFQIVEYDANQYALNVLSKFFEKRGSDDSLLAEFLKMEIEHFISNVEQAKELFGEDYFNIINLHILQGD